MQINREREIKRDKEREAGVKIERGGQTKSQPKIESAKQQADRILKR